MKITVKCEESVRPTFDRERFEASLKPGDIFYRKADSTTILQVNGLMVFMRLKQTEDKYVNLLSNNLFNTLCLDKEYFLAPNVTMVLNIETK